MTQTRKNHEKQATKLGKKRRLVARAVFEAAEDIDQIARRFGMKADTVRRWLREPRAKQMIHQLETEQREQMRRLAVRYGPSAAARLIQDLNSADAGNARRAAEAILKLAFAFSGRGEADDEPPRAAAGHVDDEKADRILEILADGKST